MNNKILIIGPGAYGLALANILSKNPDNQISLYGLDAEKLNLIQQNQYKFKGVKIKPVANVYSNFVECFKQKYNAIILAVPAKAISEVISEIKKYIDYNVPIINTVKGLKENNEFWVDYIQASSKHFQYCYLAGPSFADDLLKQRLSFCELFTTSQTTFQKVEKFFKNTQMVLEHKTKIQIAEYISSYKNVLAICFGMIHAITKSKSTIYGLFVLALKELETIISYKFKQKINLVSFNALGDINMCCFCSESRNFQYGYNLIKQKHKQSQSITIEGKRSFYIIAKDDAIPVTNKFINIFYKVLVYLESIEGRVSTKELNKLLTKLFSSI